MSKTKKRHPLPEGWHDADSLSEILGVTKKALLARLREETWLKTDKKGGTRGGIHNLPHQHYIELGLLKTQTRTYGMRGGFESIGHSYVVALFHKNAIPTIREIMNTKSAHQTNHTPRPKPAQQKRIAPSLSAPVSPKTKATLAERDACLNQLEAWGIPVSR